MKATHNVADIVRELKKASTAWINDEAGLRNFRWQEGYAAFTVGYRERVRAYIERQEEHHGQKDAFKKELLSLLEHHGVEYDPKYLLVIRFGR